MAWGLRTEDITDDGILELMYDEEVEWWVIYDHEYGVTHEFRTEEQAREVFDIWARELHP